MTFRDLERRIKASSALFTAQQQHGKFFEELDKKPIPLDPQKFYECMGLIEHPLTHKPVKHLTDYQTDVWRRMQQYKYNLIIKSQKIGLSTSVLMADFQFAILPSGNPLSCRGHEILIIGQSIALARDHLYTLRKMILESKLYRDFLIDRPTEVVMRDQVSKVTMLYVHNPTNPFRPTRIIGLGAKEGAVWSWKQVKHVHISDIAAANTDYTGTISAALTRLANTNGTMIIESPPRGPQGKLYEIYTKSLEEQRRKKTKEATGESRQEGEGQFQIKRISYRAALASCSACQKQNIKEEHDDPVMSKAQLEGYKKMFGSEFPAYFEAQFITLGGNVFELEHIERAEVLGDRVDYTHPNVRAPKSMGVDPGFGSSNFAILITQMNNDRIEVIYTQEYRKGSPSGLLETAWELAFRYGVNKIYIDGANAGYVRDLKRMLGENTEFEKELRRIAQMGLKPDQFMRVVPRYFGTQGKEMLYNVQRFLQDGLLAIPNHHQFQPLLRQMRSAIEVNGSLDKSRNPLDSLDALRLACSYYHYNG
jgi:hypothetical protein